MYIYEYCIPTAVSSYTNGNIIEYYECGGDDGWIKTRWRLYHYYTILLRHYNSYIGVPRHNIMCENIILSPLNRSFQTRIRRSLNNNDNNNNHYYCCFDYNNVVF